jgi:tetratricopeptide (TPR) repeat protein
VEGAAARPQAAGRTLGADYVLRATLRWARGTDGQPRVQVSPVLVRVSDGTTRWAGEPTVVAPADAFTVQGVLATEVADALDVALAPAERTRLAQAGTSDTAAFAALERGHRIMLQASDTLPLLERFRRALSEFETAYRRDPGSAEAWGKASSVLGGVGSVTGNTALHDSAAVLARRALALDPGEAMAVNTLAGYEMVNDRASAARALLQRAVRAHPSNAELRLGLALSQYVAGDTARAWPEALEALRLAPRSPLVLDQAFRIALGLRRYGDAGEVAARRRALDPADGWSEVLTARVAAARGDTGAVTGALRAYQAKGGQFRAADQWWYGELTPLLLLRHADRALGEVLLAGTPATFGAQRGEDSVHLYAAQTALLLRRGEAARARPLLARGLATMRRLSDEAPPRRRAEAGPDLAWFAAALGDRATADGALAAYSAAFAGLIGDAPGGQADAVLTCMRAEVAGFLGDVAAMLAPLRRCLTMTSGYPVAALRTESAFARHAADPRVQALAAELAAAEQRARTTPVPVAR